ncbi:D-alanyl-D-alanine carboxypeptidase DacF precursor [Roseovarius albus]|uniref:D-alanyl-D-alanine carboxypeptidase DacF n=1 Tax=Roseovarius albus TaxID=1247867 RepID=A0A1X6Y586_9RHOB|nr:D-alanyl-D-alanine carboxypeptidase family protein [Roseovarius albus]SLN10763.1 D-alanyl-D-alanine carboxypeptidase DacF precursor [Roseovarius albus]
MKTRSTQPIRLGLVILATIWMLVVLPLSAIAAPYAAMVIDARSGEVLHSRNADSRLHPASLTKMMTLYIVFEAVENGEISLDSTVTISKHAASEPPSKLGLRAGQKIKLRYLIRAAAIKSANDAATALGEAIEGSEARFARRMNRTAKALGMTRTTFKNAHGLTESGHLSTARDMTTLGRHVFYDYPDYYNIFSRVTDSAAGKTIYHTNRKMLRSYRGADGIKTGYTRAAGFNLVASAERGRERIIATVFGGRSTATRNARVAELLDMGFKRAPTRVAVHKPRRPAYLGKLKGGPTGAVGKTVRLASAAAVKRSLRPQSRPLPEAEPLLIAEAPKDDIEAAILAAQAAATEDETTVAEAVEEVVAEAETTVEATPTPEPQLASAVVKEAPRPVLRPKSLILTKAEPVQQQDAIQEVVTRVSTSGGRNWGINVGRYPSQYKARSVLLKTALNEMATLDGSLRKVVRRPTGFDANFMGLSEDTAQLACRRLQARKITCETIEPGGGA